MYIQLMHRHYGCHRPIKHLEIDCDFNKVYLGVDQINEELLLKSIPEGWLPTKPSLILLNVCNKYGGIGQSNLNVFRNWAKYFDAYCLELHKEPLDWWDEEKKYTEGEG